MTIGSSNKQTNQQLQQEYQKSTLHLSKAENTTKNLQLKIAEQNKKIKSLTTTIEYLRQTEATHQRFQLASQEDLKAKELALNQSQANERLLLDQNQQYKKLAILGGITTSLAIGFIVAEKYWDNR